MITEFASITHDSLPLQRYDLTGLLSSHGTRNSTTIAPNITSTPHSLIAKNDGTTRNIALYGVQYHTVLLCSGVTRRFASVMFSCSRIQPPHVVAIMLLNSPRFSTVRKSTRLYSILLCPSLIPSSSFHSFSSFFS